MNKITITVVHNLTRDEAVSRIKNLLHDLKTQHAEKIGELHEEWERNTGKFNFSAMGFPVSGTLIVKPLQVEISGNLPLIAIPFKEKIANMIKNRAETLLA